MKVPMLSIVIPTYGKKGAALTNRCLEALWESGLVRPNDPTPAINSLLRPEIVVVDDGSDDATMIELQQICTQHGVLRLLHTARNTAHFAANVNAGIEQTSGQVVVVLNNDVEVLPGCLQTLSRMCIDLGFGIAAPKLIYPDTDDYPEQFRGKIQFGGMVYVENTQEPSQKGWFDHALRFQPRWNYSACRISEGLVTGACFAINRNAIDMVGLFDTRFELTCEDVDLCLRVMLAGLTCAYVGVAEAVHKEGATRGNTVEAKALHPEWNEREARSLAFLFEKWPLVQFRAFNTGGKLG